MILEETVVSHDTITITDSIILTLKSEIAGPAKGRSTLLCSRQPTLGGDAGTALLAHLQLKARNGRSHGVKMLIWKQGT
ncbi:hypothetical protein PF005_g10956 [Phytophthora fragariae]|uniref:Uncharacterized protein n=1 Tax=Phytophthora fragariae TaxID=53985 RepID=A0A6A3Y0L5_9STRA|nr:hypothetical protein PF003_g10918 [Phytophthora fragariae]KAE9009961.1 hypothetical protein PF011_g10026 [Phytophthora fragariae]KAE9105770.1 hypothetical protein PF006_g21533 [Phytophthora fragariae]KAE9124889.1 hypothetical protein PF007_g6561 [Phytophthora fragariae]KAE9211563.1 hypothetical protein PF005_g10956 [Phytophthora fragariae]